MTASRSSLSRAEIVDRLTELLGADRVDTDADRLRAASVDRYKKYAAAHGMLDGPFPAAIVRPATVEQVADVLRFADDELVNIVPRSGGTATEGGLETVVEDSVVLDGSGLDAILDIDPVDMTATVQSGVPLQALEDAVREHGLTTGHSPQSRPLAQLGGLVATRSIGQLSTLYGGIEDLVVGCEAVLPGGAITRIKAVPRRAAGPDLRHIVIGSEGTLCFVTEVTVKLFTFRPETCRYFGYLVDDFGAGIDGLRRLVTDGYRPSVCRVYSPQDATQHFGDLTEGRNLVVVVTEGPERLSAATAEAVEEVFAGVQPVDPGAIEAWFTDLNWGPDRIRAEYDDMVRRPHLGYTTEVSCSWSQAAGLYDAVTTRLEREFPRFADITMLGAHSSHSYQTGTNLYFVYDYDVQCDPREELAEYHVPINAIVVEEALRAGGSMVHHHGIGKYRTPWVRQEHGSAYVLLEGLKQAFDPNGVMNAGTIFPLDGFTDPFVGIPGREGP